MTDFDTTLRQDFGATLHRDHDSAHLVQLADRALQAIDTLRTRSSGQPAPREVTSVRLSITDTPEREGDTTAWDVCSMVTDQGEEIVTLTLMAPIEVYDLGATLSALGEGFSQADGKVELQVHQLRRLAGHLATERRAASVAQEMAAKAQADLERAQALRDEANLVELALCALRQARTIDEEDPDAVVDRFALSCWGEPNTDGSVDWDLSSALDPDGDEAGELSPEGAISFFHLPRALAQLDGTEMTGPDDQVLTMEQALRIVIEAGS